MKPVFVNTKNVKNFISTINNLQNRAQGVPGMALIYGEPGLGKTRAAIWWVSNHQDDAIFVSAKQSMSTKWLLEEIVKELGDSPFYRTADIFEQITRELIKRQGYLFIKDFENFEPPKTTRVKPFIEGSEYDKFKQKQKEKEKKEKSDKPKNYGFFVPHNELSEKFSFYEIINNFLEKYAAKFCTPSTIQTYRSLLKNHILPYFKTKRPPSHWWVIIIFSIKYILCLFK